MNWSDPAARYELAERIGIAAYNRAHEAHRAATVLETVAGHALRSVGTRWGRLIAVGDTGRAFRSIDEARVYARLA